MDDARPVPMRLRVDRRRAGIAVLAVALVALSVALLAGALAPLDRHAVAHWMLNGPDPENAQRTVPALTGVFVPFHPDDSWSQRALDVWLYPASVLVSVVVFALAFGALWRRGARAEAAVWAIAFVATNVVEVVLKAALVKPALYAEQDGVRFHVAAFDHSFPSGHMTRALLVAGVVAYVWRRLGWVVAVWAVLVPVVLVLASWHTPSDVAGGLALGGTAVLATWGVARARRA